MQDFLAAVTAHIPNRGEHLVRYYGYYSSVQRGRRQRQGREDVAFKPPPPADEAPHAKVARALWARFIKKVFAADPLACPDCGGAMRIVAFIEDRRVVRAILEHLSLRDEPRPRPRRRAHRSNSSACPGWSELHLRAGRKSPVAPQGAWGLFRISGDSSRDHAPAEP